MVYLVIAVHVLWVGGSRDTLPSLFEVLYVALHDGQEIALIWPVCTGINNKLWHITRRVLEIQYCVGEAGVRDWGEWRIKDGYVRCSRDGAVFVRHIRTTPPYMFQQLCTGFYEGVATNQIRFIFVYGVYSHDNASHSDHTSLPP